MRGIKTGIVAILSVGLLAGSTVGVSAQDSATASPQGEPGLDVHELVWAPLDLDEATFGPGARFTDIAASDSLVVIGGSVGGNAAVWTSTDRVNWRRVPHDRKVFGGPHQQVITALVPWRDGFVAAGEVRGINDFQPARVAVVWISKDGTTWERVPHDEAVFGGKGRQEMFDIAASDDRLVIVGFDEEGPCCTNKRADHDIAVWTSANGIDWKKRTLAGGEMFAVQGTPDGFFATGGGGPWKSKDGRKWDAQDTSAVGRAWLAATAANSDGLVAVGSVADGPAVWTSPDGSDWSRATIDETVRLDDGVGLMDVASSSSGLAAVAGPGYYGGDSAVLVSADGKTWEQGNTPAGIADAGLQGITALGPHFVAIGGSRFDPDAGPSILTTFEPESALADKQSEADDVAATTNPDLLPGVDLVTEEAEPGVYRILSDSTGHDLSSAAPAWHTFGPDGEVVVFASEGMYPLMTSFFTLGTEESNEFDEGDRPRTWFFDAAVAADGALWAILDAGWGATNRLGVFDGSSWKTLERPAGSGLAGVESGPDGDVWAARTAQNGRGPRVGRILDGEWSRLPESDDPALQSYYSGGPFVIGPDGTPWFANGGIGPIRQDFRGLLRFDGEDWQVVVPDAARAGAFVNEVAIGPEGTVWVYLIPGVEPDKPRLARLDADGWEVFTAKDGVPSLDRYGGASPDIAVDEAGTLWIAINDGFGLSLDESDSDLDLVHRCPGVLSFDGSEWTRYLVGVCVNHIEIGPTGYVWGSAPFSEAPVSRAAVNSEPATRPGGLYVITPEAVAAAG